MSEERMGHEDFQTSVIKTLTRLETKMDLLVGPDGNNGKISVIEGQIADLKSVQDQATGNKQSLGWIKTVAASGLGVGVGAAIQKVMHW